ncbi:histidine phosphatase family protein [Rugosimonospora acidiphila]|uniref:Histidine phosphatase family protein n=1 Tax=Rugosimonospora acidiphila TaxID=556531 RepID=A0ABP9RPA5_9ACTN
MDDVGDIILIRHGQTEWSANGRHTSYTDLPLTPDGEREAEALRPGLAGRRIGAVLSSPLRRARRTAELAGLTVTETSDDLAEWNYGAYEGITSKQIHEGRPDWSLWRDGCPEGESPEQVGARMDRALARARELAAGDDDVVLVGHGHSLRVCGARWIGLDASHGAGLLLSTATVSALGFEHHLPAIVLWNAPVGAA